MPAGQAALARKEATARQRRRECVDRLERRRGRVGPRRERHSPGWPAWRNHTFDIGIVDQPLVSIGNFVWNDLNNDGIFEARAKPGIGGVTVNLYAADGTTFLGTQQTTTGPAATSSTTSGPAGTSSRSSRRANYASSTGKNGNLSSGPYEPGVDVGGNRQQRGPRHHPGRTGRIRAAVDARWPRPATRANPDTNGLQANNANFSVDFGLYRLAVGRELRLDRHQQRRQVRGGRVAGRQRAWPVNLLDGAGNVVMASTATDANGNYLLHRPRAPAPTRCRVLAPGRLQAAAPAEQRLA